MATGPVRALERVRFGEDFELDLRAYELRRSGRVLKLERIPMELLFLLVQQRDNIVTREQIVERIWGTGVFLDTDNSINTAIRKIRQVLRDNPERPRFVQTVTGKGYRFIAPVSGAQAELQILDNDPETPADVPPTNMSARRPWAIPVGILIVLIVALSGWLVWSHNRSNAKPAVGRLMLAVLPFENLTGDTGQDYFSDGLTEEMITQLGWLDPAHLGVIARTSVMHYKDRRQPLDQIARELGVQYVLEGSVRRDGGTVRITAQLIQAKDQTHLWAQEYDRQLKDLLVLQGQVAQAVADEIQLTLGRRLHAGSSLAAMSPQQYEAYDLYLRGRYFWNKRTPQGFQQAQEYFEESIRKNPRFAFAYAGLADTYSMMSCWGYTTEAYVVPARTAAHKALELDPNLAEVHTSLAVIAQNFDWDWKTAEKEYRRAIELDPNYVTAHHWYGEFLAFQGRFDESRIEYDRALQLDPLSLIIASDRGALLYYARDYEKAIEQFRHVLDVDPNYPRAHEIVGPYAETGRFQDALAHLGTWRHFGPDSPWILAEEAYVYRRSGQQAKARAAVIKVERWPHREEVTPALMVYAYIGAGDKDRAFAWLEKAYKLHSFAGLTNLKVSPLYDPVRDDPRFENLLQRAGLAE
jgi:TolB-like protein/DNA-binding winged helix-turn-helix (wHTH) protein/Flp pilus assembly protein TadD